MERTPVVHEIPIVKMSGTGNDFLMIDNRSLKYDNAQVKAFTVAACPRRVAAGADGVIWIEPATEPGHDYKMRIINADGSEAEMCGNGSRCAAVFAHKIGAAKQDQRFQTLAGTLNASVPSDLSYAKVQLSAPSKMELKEVDVCGRKMEIYFIDTGVPHAVIFVADVSTVDVKTEGRDIRFHHEFKPRGTNVNFVQLLENNTLKVRTYERGIEDETFACGTGSTASAVISGLIHNYISPVKIITRGGALLTIYYEIDAEKQEVLDAPFLEGAVDTIYEGKYYWKH